MIHRFSYPCYFLFILIPFFSCEDNVVFEKKIKLSSGKWYYQDTLEYKWEIKDTSREYKLLMLVEHDTEYPYQNIYFKIHTHFPRDSTKEQVLSVDLADHTGKWYGKCNGSRCKVEFTLQEKVLFAQSGNYQIQMEQYMRTDSVAHIRSIALRLLDTGTLQEI